MSRHSGFMSFRRKKVRPGARVSRTMSGVSPWARRWMSALDYFNIGPKMGRHRTYARKAHVTSMKIRGGTVRAVLQEPGHHIPKKRYYPWVRAMLQASRRRSYEAEVRIKALPEERWGLLAETLMAKPAMASKVLAGRMPDGIEEEFKAIGLDLFPPDSDLVMDCSCPDWYSPCRHIVTIFLLLADELERDPFLIFRLRGIDTRKLLRMAGFKPAPDPRPGSRGPPPTDPDTDRLPPEPLPADPGRFWGSDPGEYYIGETSVPRVHAQLPRQLGSFPFWGGDEDFDRVMKRVYRDASRAGMRTFLGRTRTAKKG